MLKNGEYYYSNTLKDADKVVFIGNSSEAYIKGITVQQFPNGFQVPVGGIILYEGEDIPANYETVQSISAPAENIKYIKRVR